MFGLSNRKTAGAVVVDGRHIADTSQCVHCGGHFKVIPGSGTKRGWCPKCKGVLCGGMTCMTRCVPFEQMLEKMEGKKHNFKTGI